MGTDGGKAEELPIHDVTVDAFWIDRTEVTNAQFEAFVQAAGLQTEAERAGSGHVYTVDSWQPLAGADWRHPQGPGSVAEPNHPVVLVTWDEANAFCAWAGGRLPTEAEWEFAARGPESLPFPWGLERDTALFNSCDVNCPYEWRNASVDDGYRYTAPVGAYPGGASWVGALDMIGNVWEWVNDWYDENAYTDAPRVNPTGPESGLLRVIRGVAWVHEPSIHYSANRGRGFPNAAYNGFGFRCAGDDEGRLEPLDNSPNPLSETPIATSMTPTPTAPNTASPKPAERVISLVEPADCNRPANFRDTWSIEFKWEYAGSLAPGQYMEVRIEPNTGIASQGKVTGPITGNQWLQVVSVSNFDIDAGSYRWQVVLMDSDGSSALVYSDYGCFTIWSDNG
jgi:formylglycine-generating enzyme required for sulfatase activity